MAAPELRLEVSLGLNTFRDQMRKLVNIAQSEFTAQLNVKFNREQLTKELTNLRRAVGRGVYRVEIGGNWENLPTKIASLQKALQDLRNTKKIELEIGGVASIKDKEAKKIRTALHRQLLSNGGKLLIPATITPKITKPDIKAFKDAIQAKLGTIEVKVKAVTGEVSPFAKGPLGAAGLAEYMRTQGASGEAFGARGAGQAARERAVAGARESLAREAVLSRLEKKSLSEGGYNVPGLKQIVTRLGGTYGAGAKRADLVAQAKALIQESKNIQDSVFAELRDLQLKLRPLRGTGAMPGAFFASRGAGNYQDILSSIAGLTKNPRAAGLMLRQLPEERIKTNILDVATRQAQYYREVPSARSLQRDIKGFDPVLKAIAESFAAYTKSLNPSNPWVGKIGDGFKDVVRVAAQSATTKLLPAAGMTSANRMSRAMFEGLPPLQAPMFGPLGEKASASLDRARQLLGLPIGPTSVYTANPWAGRATVPPAQAARTTGPLLLPPARGEIAAPTNIRTIAGAPSAINPGVILSDALKRTLPEFTKLSNSLSLLSESTLSARRKIDQIGFQNLPTSITGLKGKSFDKALNAALAESRGMAAFTGQVRPLFQGRTELPAASIREALQRIGGRGPFTMESPASARFAGILSAARSMRGQQAAGPAPGIGGIENLFRPVGGTGGIAGRLERLAAAATGLPPIQGVGAPGVGGINNLFRPASGTGGIAGRLEQLAAAAAGLPSARGTAAPGIGSISSLYSSMGSGMRPLPRLSGVGIASIPPGERGRSGFGGGTGGGAGGAPFSPGGRNRNVFGDAVAGMSLPGKGIALELANEFKYATQQVLLFGAAYKALAFVQSFPAQVGEAVAQLQAFNNTLKSITPTAQEASSSNEFVLGMVERYNIPLESARSGFTKLYASMTPAGFKGDEIRDLFAGISKAAATFGMSADKVDRVTYAFAQMASKGQVMSEELKGQLGDVLPGALGLFAEAAGLKGPDAITKFTKALEDGAYKGEPMKVLLKNVSYLMNKEFGPGAEGAAKTFQGVMNRMANSTKFFYESFEPVAVAFANQVIIPISQGLRDITDGTKEFLSGQKASTESGAQFAAILKDMAPAINGIVNNIKQLGNGFSAAGQIIGNTGKAILSVLSLPIVGYLGSAYGSVLLLVGAFNLLGGQALVAAIASAGRFITMMMGLVTQSIASSAAVYGTSSALQTLHAGLIANGASLQVYRAAMIQATAATQTFGTMLQTVIIRSVVGVALVGLGLLAAKIMEVRGQMEAIQAAAKSMQEGARISAKFGLVEQTKENVGNIKAMHNTYQKLREEFKNLKGMDAGLLEFEDYAVVSTSLYKKLLELGLLQESQAQKVANGYKVTASVLVGIGSQIDEQEKVLGSAYEKAKSYIKAAEDAAARQKKQQQGLLAIPPGAPDPKAGDKAAEDARKLADVKRKYESDLMKLNNEQAMALSDIEFEHWKTLQDQKFDYAAAGQNEWMQRELKFQKDLQAIEIRRMETVRRANQESQKAAVEAAAAAYVAQSGGGGMTGAGRATFGATGRVFNAPGWVHGHFQNMNREALVRDTTDVVMKLLSQGVKTELGSGAKFSSGMSQQQVEGLVRSGIAGHKQYGSGVGAVDIFVPEGTRVPVPLSNVAGPFGAGGIQGTLPGGTELMHLAPGSAAGGGVGAAAGATPSRVRAEMKKDGAAMLEMQQAMNARERESATIKNANAAAQREINILIKEYVASILPVEQLKLENSLIADKNALLSSGVYGEALDTEMKIGEAQKRTALGIEQASKRIAENNDLAQKGVRTKEETNRLNEIETKRIADLKKGLEEYLPLLRQKLQLEQQSAEATLRASIQRATPLGGMGLAAGFIGQAGTSYEEAIGRGATPQAAKAFAELQNQYTLLEVRNEAIKSSILGIGDAFGTAMTTGIASLVDGTGTAKEVFSNFLKSIGQALLQAAAQMIATYIAIGIARIFAGLGGGAKPDMSVGAITERAGIGATSSLLQGFANGGVASGGFVPFKAFAGGGVVNGPTLGLVGEGKYNEAIVPLPDGRSIPVVMKGESQSSRSLLSSNGGAGNGSPVLSMNFTTTTINGVEYVSRDQLEAAMMETRKLAAREGAQRGAVLAIDKLQQSPTTRRRIGL